MKLREIIAIADNAYPDGRIGEVYGYFLEAERALARHPWREASELVGDSLAVFIAIELVETYDACDCDFDQMAEAVRVMVRARQELENVELALAHQYERMV